jgi:hydrogenase nickel incorporation protein HypA/HybF
MLMHELSITRNTVAIVSEHAHGRRVLRVRLQIGQLSAIQPEAIRFCFDVCTADTLLAGATLEIDEVPGRARCTHCGETIALTVPTGRCPACGTGSLQIIAGEEILIREIETATEETSCA